MNKTRILLIEDHQLVREAWNLMLSSYEDFEIIGEIDTIDAVIPAVRNFIPDVILLDLNINGELSIDLVPEICNILPNPKIIIVSMNTEYFLIKKMFQLGVKGYISKSASSKDLIAGIRTVFAGSTYTSPEISRLFLEKTINESTNLKISSKDLIIIKAISNGKSNKEIANDFNISEKTVEARKTQIFKNLNIKNSPELVNFAIKNGLI